MARTPLFGRLGRLIAQARRERAASEPHGAAAAPTGAPNRRDVLRGAASVAAVAALPALPGCDPLRPEDLRVGIVGGGMAGVHCAWRLARAGVTATVFESSDRIGGRMWTGRGLFADGQVFEIGGELIDSNHATLWTLAEELGITLDDRFASPYDALVNDTWHVNGAIVEDATLLAQLQSVLADIEADYEAAESDDAAFTALDEETLEAWLDRRVPVATARELHDVLSVAYRGEFGLENAEQSALNLIYLFGLDSEDFRIFGDSDERYHTQGGNDTFISKLIDGLDPAQLRTGHALIKAEGSGPFTLTLESADGEVVEEFDHVVFALPFTRLRTCDLMGLELSDTKRQIVDELGYGTNAKVMAGFTRPVWREDHGASGSLTTDRPVQQTWDTSIGQSGASAILTNFLGGAQGLASGTGTPDAWVTGVVLPDLEAVFPGSAGAYVPDSAQRMHWPTYAHSLGSYTCYRPGQWSFWPMEGEREGGAHFAGEHASADFQGWMEGAAESGARVASEILDDHGFAADSVGMALTALRQSLPPSVRGQPLTSLRARRRAIGAWVAARRRR